MCFSQIDEDFFKYEKEKNCCLDLNV